MNIFDILPDPRLVDLFRAILESGGVIHGGCIRDLIRYGNFQVRDVDIYYDSSLIQKTISYNSETINNLTNLIKSKPSFQHIDYFRLINSPINTDYDVKVDQFELGIPCTGYRQHYDLEEEVIVIDLIFRKGSFESRNNLDFDINSLYVLPDGTISSLLGADKVSTVISNIRNRKCRLMRSDVLSDRINHMLDKGYQCNLILFL